MSLFLGTSATGGSFLLLAAASRNFTRHLRDRAVPEFSSCTSCRFLSAIDGIAKHLRDRLSATKKVHLKTVGLFLRPRLGINAPDVLF